MTGECGHLPSVRVWDMQDRTCVAEFPGHKYGINCVAFAPNNKYIVSVSCAILHKASQSTCKQTDRFEVYKASYCQSTKTMSASSIVRKVTMITLTLFHYCLPTLYPGNIVTPPAPV